MISFIDRAALHVSKYDRCIENSYQSRAYALSWYLDAVCSSWGALVLNDYEAVMPIPWNRKYGIKYVYPPLWVLELGVFSSEKKEVDQFIDALAKEFKFIELRLNTDNFLTETTEETITKRMQWISLEQEYADIFGKYRKDRKKDLTKAERFDLKEVWHDEPEKLVTLFKANIGRRDLSIKERDYNNLLSLICDCLKRGVGEVLSVYDVNDQLVASAFFIVYNKTATILVSSTDLKNRNNGANTFLIDKAIAKYHKKCHTFNFGGSSIPSVASYFKSFGATDAEYHFIKQNRLPKLVQLLRR